VSMINRMREEFTKLWSIKQIFLVLLTTSRRGHNLLKDSRLSSPLTATAVLG